MDKTLIGNDNLNMSGDATVTGTITSDTTEADKTLHSSKTLCQIVPSVQPLMPGCDVTEDVEGDDLVTFVSDDVSGKVVPLISAGEVSFILKGKKYRAIKSISESSGEAQIVLVKRGGKQYCLKVYYPNHHFKDNILNAVWNLHADMVVKLYDYGHTTVNGVERDYELMEYLEGGTLSQFHFEGDMRQFRLIALQAAAALSACHSFGIIHKDIKPANYFFRDKEHTQLVLGDFGISTMMKEGEELKRTSQARTPAFAAPEMYDDVIDGEVEIDTRVDFYSLGITLLYLWLGKSPFAKNERLMMRLKQEGRIPHVEELPERVSMVIRGLTSVNPKRRWGYEEVERWFLGEDVPVDTSSVYLRYKAFMIDPERNLVAHDLKELVPLLYDNQQLGIRYLYSNRISAWLDECGNNKMAVLLTDIVEHRYPTNQHAGLMAALYAMEPGFPYYDIKGKVCRGAQDIAISLLNHAKDYQYKLQDPFDTLFVYLDSHFSFNMERLRAYFQPADDKSVLKLVYEIDHSLPFLASAKCDEPSDLLDAFASPERTEEEWDSLTNGCLVAWLYGHADISLCEGIKFITSHSQSDKRTTAYQVLYNLDRTCAFDLKEANTIEKVAELMADKLRLCQDMDDSTFAYEMRDFISLGGRLEIYAQLHQWQKVLSSMHEILDLESPANTERFGMYDLRTAAFKLCKAMGGEPVYEFDGDDYHVLVQEPEQLHSLPIKDVRSALRNKYLTQWLSVFFHEDPSANFKNEAHYNECVKSFLQTVGNFDGGEIHYKRYMIATEQLEKKVSESHEAWSQSIKNKNIFRTAFVGINLLWLFLLLAYGINETDNLKNHVYMYTMLAVGVPLGAMLAVRNYFRGNGFLLGLLYMVIGFALSLIPALFLSICLNHSPGTARWLVLGLSTLYLGIGLKYAFGKGTIGTSPNELKDAFDVDEQDSLREILFYTFRTRSFKFKGSTFSLMDDAVGEVRSNSTEKVINCVMWSLVPTFLIMAMFWYHSAFLDHAGPDVESWKDSFAELWQNVKALFQ